jgi:predicted SprT family Zn-dependent metalloprotease
MGDALFVAPERGSSRLRFSIPLWPRASEEERRETVIHECAHLVDGLRHGRPDGHGPHWKKIMVEAGFSPDRTHKVDRQGLTRTVAAHCRCKDWSLGRQRAARLRNRTAEYRCPKCGDLLELGPRPRSEEEVLEDLLALDRKARQAALEEEARKLREAAQEPAREAVTVKTTRTPQGQLGWRW